MLIESAKSDDSRKIIGRDSLVKELFSYLLMDSELKYDFLLLCSNTGLVLDFRNSNAHHQETLMDFCGHMVNLNFFNKYPTELVVNKNIDGYTLITSIMDNESADLNQLIDNLKMLLSIFDDGSRREQFVLGGLDFVENAICVYDKDATLLYGNKAFFDNMQVSDRKSAIGMNILDMTKKSGIKIQATKNGSNNLKMMDVLKYGRKILDWEVMIKSQTSPNKAHFISNNMYPIKDQNRNVEGMIEISYSHQLSLNKTKKLMGLTAEYTFDSIVGNSPALTNVIHQAKEFSDSPYNLLIIGESGVGKELFAQAIHNHSSRRNEPFVALNCASFPENLIESELFGYVGGSFTGASKNGQIGKFELADGGTLFLDEIGELPFTFQSKLLRVLETRKITRIGSSSPTPVNVRVLAATNRNLEKMIEENLFRKDLYYRLQVLNIEIPPLRDRQEDLLLLTDSFFHQASDINGEEPKTLAPEAQKALLEYSWPGNVRELRNVIQRLTLLSKTQVVSKDLLEAAIHAKGYSLYHAEESHATKLPDSENEISSLADPSAAGSDNPDTAQTHMDKLAKCKQQVNDSYVQLINEALSITGGNKSRAAELLGVSRRTFYRMVEKYCT